MSIHNGERIFGVETEFGCLVGETMGSPEAAVELVKDCLFYDLKQGALDMHSRDDVFEPAQCGGFLLNGGRMYIDAVGSHLEYATAECRDLKDLIANDRAGQRMIVRAIEHMGLSDEIDVYNNSVDHFGGHTFGCHENYLVRADGDLLSESAGMLYPFLVTRQIFAGVGRVGGHILTGGLRPSYQEVMDNPIDYIWVSQVYGVMPDNSVPFQLSQRADHILKTIASRVRFNRALINPKWEHFYSHDGMTRLHLLFGESNQNEYAYALKIGTTSLVLDLLEDGLAPELSLANPLQALREVSRDQSYRWNVEMADGRTMGSVDLQRAYLKEAQRFKGRSEQTDWILIEWESVLDGLESDPLAMGDRLDWVAKRKVVEDYIRQVLMDESPAPAPEAALPPKPKKSSFATPDEGPKKSQVAKPGSGKAKGDTRPAMENPDTGPTSGVPRTEDLSALWTSDALHSVDLEYHNIDPAKSLFHGLQLMGRTRRVATDREIVDAMTEPPQNTRALGRSQLVQEVLKHKSRFYLFDWNGVALDRNTYVEMPDPFETYSRK